MTVQNVETKKIIITHADDTITITSLVVSDGRGIADRALVDDYINAVVTKIEQAYSNAPETAHMVPFKSWRLVKPDETLPSDRTFRSAWKHDDSNEINVCMVKAREIHRDRLRSKRNAELEKLDIEGQRALEEGDNEKLAIVKAKKQKLRDLPKVSAIDDAETPDELKLITVETHGR